jgi:hypothetical protein
MLKSLKQVRRQYLITIKQVTIMLRKAIYNRRQNREYN